ncbi:MAG: hypothetical protein ACOYN5_09030, partial [Bacteroidales bacterium]
YHNQATNTIVVYNTSSRSLKEIKVIVKGSEHYEIELMINDLPYRGSIEVPLDSFKNSADIKVSLFIIDNWERYIFKEDGVIKRIK